MTTLSCEQQSSTLFYLTDPAFSPWSPIPPLYSLIIPRKKTQQKQVTKTPQHFHTIPTSCAILLSMHTTKLLTCSMHTTKLSTCTLTYLNPLNKLTSDSQLLTHHPSYTQGICHVQQDYNFTTQHAIHTQHCLCTSQFLRKD